MTRIRGGTVAIAVVHVIRAPGGDDGRPVAVDTLSWISAIGSSIAAIVQVCLGVRRGWGRFGK